MSYDTNNNTNKGNNMKETDELEFDAVINVDSKPMVLLPEGEYRFTVLNYKQGEYTQKDTNQVKKKVTLILGIQYNGDEVIIQESIPLLKSLEWKFCSFFTSIGDRKHNEPLKMDWNKVNGKMGSCSIKHEKYQNKFNSESTSNKVDRFLEPKDNTQVSKPTYQAPKPSYQATEIPWNDQF